ncbi:tripartite motif-containing protein 59-like [Ostrea edulis]|uniref:tripartite motif-containing protein 59-like n=1 Tax=Ostrea edulis TaxID=37623 RepID=UPI002095CD66|nr:tripartite motif-containing protein 59-like [Ostrea edulis]XP_048754938.1 tripartite motif-containing protein 59-like [Ostrea edulis]
MASGSEDVADSVKRSLIVDEAAFEEQFLRCHICNEKYNQVERHPKSLPCNHTFCLPCLKQVFDHNQQNGRSRRQIAWFDDTYEGVLKCPECRVEIFLSRTEIDSLPSDHRVIQMMDFLSQVSAKSQNVCPKHENQPLNFFCKKCLLPVCRDCTVLDHKEGQGHNIVDVSEAVNESKESFDKIDQSSKQLLDKMKGRTDGLANASKQLDLLERQLRGTIKDTFIEYRLLLERRQEALIKILKDTIKEQKTTINSRFVEIATQGSTLQKLHDQFQKARSVNDLKKLFEIQQEIKEKESEFKVTADANDDELFVTCKFDVPNECQFLSEMSGLGEVTTCEDQNLRNPVPAHQLVLLDSMEVRQPHAYIPDYPEEQREEPNEEPSSVGRLRRQLQNTSITAPYATDDDYEEQDEDTREAIASSYLMRIASRLNQSAADMAEVLRTANTDDDTNMEAVSPPRSRNTTSSRSRRSTQNVRVVRHPSSSSGGQRTEQQEQSHAYPQSSSSRYRDSNSDR